MAGKKPLHPAPTLTQSAIKSDTAVKVPQPVVQLSDSLLWLAPWAHHVIWANLACLCVPLRRQEGIGYGW